MIPNYTYEQYVMFRRSILVNDPHSLINDVFDNGLAHFWVTTVSETLRTQLENDNIEITMG